MLDSNTKHKIDRLRKLLVGKVPDPKGQVEQITLALMFKFMNDMDMDSINRGGNKKFFNGDYEHYSWDNLFSTKLTGFERVDIYSTALEKISENPEIPSLFRDMFKDANLPFKEPKILKKFLDLIGEFQYENSENLGDAFEYLVSFMGSQGDAGQFRTPRHVIDFMVEVINPEKDQRILDPACGTSGFLISAYKHILKNNTDKNSGDLLTLEEFKEFSNNFIGYDISPDMVRLSLVNLYLHGFSDPSIYEYDTLSDDSNWKEFFDLILANPPFFSPEEGIEPHSLFQVKSSRAELVFVDYILSHISPNGRAAIIIPDGVLFREDQNAYKEIRQRLVEDCLIGIISLPKGCFEPYSGVKTSIILLDKKSARSFNEIFFTEIKNDGYALNKKREPIDKNDIPFVKSLIQDFLEKKKNDNIYTISKKEIKEKNWFLKKSLYEQDIGHVFKSFTTLGDLATLVRGPFGGSLKKDIFVADGYAVYEQSHAISKVFNNHRYYVDKNKFKEMKRFSLKENDLIMSCSGTMGRFARVPKDFTEGIINQALLIIRVDPEKCDVEFLKIVLESKLIQSTYFLNQDGTAIENVPGVKRMKEIPIPLPSIQEQLSLISAVREKENNILRATEVVQEKVNEKENVIKEVWDTYIK
tara:strand:+ start:2612 stop:4537 length:1926 start_codon:yes stop_codon:yes gene_type:complete